MTALLEALRGRRSVRRFEPRAVPRDLILSLIEAASWAPCASNRQDWEFVVVSAPGVITSMAQAVRRSWQELIARGADSGAADELRAYAANFAWFDAAPCLVVVTCKRSEGFLERVVGPVAPLVAGGRASAAMAAQNLMLAAHATGLGTCCLTGPLAAGSELATLLGLGSRRELVCLVALGYPADRPPAPARRSPQEITRFIEESPQPATSQR